MVALSGAARVMSRLSRLLSRIERSLAGRKAYRFLIRDWIGLGDLRRASDVIQTMRFTQNLLPLERTGPEARRIVVIAPHPDDEMLGPGGTLLRKLDDGSSVHTVYLTSGKPNITDEVEAETNAIAAHVGYSAVFLRFPAWDIPVDDDGVRRFADAVRDAAPTALFLPFLLDDNDDHRRASQLLCAAYARGLIDQAIEIWAYQVYTSVLPNVIVDVTNVIERKAEVIRMWESQARSRDWAHYMLGLNAYNSRFLKTRGTPTYIEAFFVVPVRDYVELCTAYFSTTPNQTYYTEQYRSS